jgi:hypothetical protein
VRRHPNRAIAIVAVAILGLTAACSSSSKADPNTSRTDAPTTTTPTVPTTTPPTAPAAPAVGVDWPRATPAGVGLDPTKLAQIATTAEAGNSNCLFVVRDAKVVFESYYRGNHAGDVQDIFSATKSTSTSRTTRPRATRRTGCRRRLAASTSRCGCTCRSRACSTGATGIRSCAGPVRRARAVPTRGAASSRRRRGTARGPRLCRRCP